MHRNLTEEAAATAMHVFLSSKLDTNSLLYRLPNRVYRLQKIQKGVCCMNHIRPVLMSLHWLPIRSTIQYKMLTLMFKMAQWHNTKRVSELRADPPYGRRHCGSNWARHLASKCWSLCGVHLVVVPTRALSLLKHGLRCLT